MDAYQTTKNGLNGKIVWDVLVVLTSNHIIVLPSKKLHFGLGFFYFIGVKNG